MYMGSGEYISAGYYTHLIELYIVQPIRGLKGHRKR